MSMSTGSPKRVDINTQAVVHELANSLAIIIGFSDLLLADLTADDPRRRDIEEIHRAAHAANAVLPRLSGVDAP